MSLEEAGEYALFNEEPDPTAASADTPSPAVETTVNLTLREREVVALVARGLTNRQISTNLGISERTAGNHVARVLRKLGLGSRTQIASWVSEHKIPALPDPD